ncbi:hypothetical protein ACN27F_31965 [Solwaraspora sp. WMMB335]|uniref:hypothetical protein n=1 Tax=Solwaraspora sp. WMMB335 TaxID=3404118 RepID=UPI003B95660B
MIIDGVARLAPVLPLDALRLARSRSQYEAVLSTGGAPSLAFGRRSWDPSTSWAGDCHADVGDPHTAADCAAHRRPSDTVDVGDPLAMIDPLPLAVQQRYPDPDAAVRDVVARLGVARDWRDAAEEAAGEPIRTLRLPIGGAPLSRRGRGILLLFEARHAMNIHVVPGPDPASSPGYWQSEAALHVFEFGLLGALGGGYETAVNVFLAKLRRTGDLLDRPERVLNRRQRKALAEPFGDIDDVELHLWASAAYRNAIYLALGSRHSPNTCAPSCLNVQGTVFWVGSRAPLRRCG